ncbi:Bestrophin, RFP-TM, chloride channel-domain-containing protein [Catenaria anguillulae PL171]|uniref:Bestrophin, RFP-TM, chloride channel-domain-containing protein n=1 Tax=Catenaria anguillulae PL171 TaxID=765915 RepID=A0A1Y2HV48_9FUNG|nr:Bestrophin, RFP-TM, chloride channel-domain-containing protein [Catenaria anguillulae PL171]
MPSLSTTLGRRGSASAAPLTHKHVTTKVRNETQVFGWPGALHYHGSVIPNVAVPVLFFTLWATFVYLLGHFAFGAVAKVSIPPTFITIISLVLSLLLVFRTNTAYERYNEGRKLFGTLIVNARNLIRLIWVSIEEKDVRDTREKVAALQLVLAYFDSKGVWRHELVSLIPRKKRDEMANRSHTHLPMLSPTAGGEGTGAARPTSPISRLRVRTHTSGGDARSALSTEHLAVPVEDEHEMAAAAAQEDECDRSNIPMDISHLLAAYVITQRKRERVDIPQFGVLTTTISNLVDTVTNLERILTSPIPIAYTVHLKQALYIYLLILPFQIIQQFFALTILIVFLAAFTLLGVESIGQEIENPFGYDLNDLPIDKFVHDMREEIAAVMSSDPIDLAAWDLNVTLPAVAPAASDSDMSATMAAGGASGSASARKALFHRSGASAYDRLMSSQENVHGSGSASSGSSPAGSTRGVMRKIMGTLDRNGGH